MKLPSVAKIGAQVRVREGVFGSEVILSTAVVNECYNVLYLLCSCSLGTCFVSDLGCPTTCDFTCCSRWALRKASLTRVPQTPSGMICTTWAGTSALPLPRSAAKDATQSPLASARATHAAAILAQCTYLLLKRESQI
eukprot:5870273-Amphidinium_carterae.1